MESSASKTACHACGQNEVREIEAFRDLSRVTSDCRSWPAGGELGVCESCGLVIAVIDDAWRTEVDEIYRTYEIYYQSGGKEQPVFSDAGNTLPRSRHLVEVLHRETGLPETGRHLDLGCGNGAFLRAVSDAFDGWQLFGTELSDKYQEEIESIPSVERLYVGGIENVEGQFDLISMIHVLEHIENPAEFLQLAAGRLNGDGLIFVEVPYFLDNPFDLVIADHSSHFTPDSLRRVAASAGLEVVRVSTSWVSKELSCVMRKAENLPDSSADPAAACDQAEASVQWLRNAREKMARPAEAESFGIFGTSIGANWLVGELARRDQSVDFFADEDTARIGRTLHGTPILGPDEIAPGSTVSIPLAPAVAEKIRAKLSGKGISLLIG